MIRYLLLTLFFVICQGFFSGMETGMVSVLRPRAEHAARQGSLRAALMRYFLQRPGIMIATALIGVNISVVMASLMAKSFMNAAGITSGLGMTVGSIVLSVIMLCFEIIPKNWFREAAFRRCCRFIPIFYGFYILLAIPVQIFSAVSGFLSKLIGRVNADSQKEPNVVMRDDFRLYLRESRTYGAVDEATASILDRAMDVPGMLIQRILIPRGKVLDIPTDMTVREAFVFCQTHNITKTPVYNPNVPGHIWIGIFSIYEAIYAVDEERWSECRVLECIGELPSIRDDLKMGKLLEKLRVERVDFFAVQDKMKKQIGIVRPEDLTALLFDNK